MEWCAIQLLLCVCERLLGFHFYRYLQSEKYTSLFYFFHFVCIIKWFDSSSSSTGFIKSISFRKLIWNRLKCWLFIEILFFFLLCSNLSFRQHWLMQRTKMLVDQSQTKKTVNILRKKDWLLFRSSVKLRCWYSTTILLTYFIHMPQHTHVRNYILVLCVYVWEHDWHQFFEKNIFMEFNQWIEGNYAIMFTVEWLSMEGAFKNKFTHNMQIIWGGDRNHAEQRIHNYFSIFYTNFHFIFIRVFQKRWREENKIELWLGAS